MAPISSRVPSTAAIPAKTHFAVSAVLSVFAIQSGAGVSCGMATVAGAGGVTSGASVGSGVGGAYTIGSVLLAKVTIWPSSSFVLAVNWKVPAMEISVSRVTERLSPDGMVSKKYTSRSTAFTVIFLTSTALSLNTVMVNRTLPGIV